MNTISATEFKAKCLDLLDQVSSGAIDSVTITKRGRVVGVLRGPEPMIDPDSVFGYMRGTVVIAEDWTPEEGCGAESFDAESGVLHR